MVLCVGRSYTTSGFARVVLPAPAEESSEGRMDWALSLSGRVARDVTTKSSSNDLRSLLPMRSLIGGDSDLPDRSPGKEINNFGFHISIDVVKAPPIEIAARECKWPSQKRMRVGSLPLYRYCQECKSKNGHFCSESQFEFLCAGCAARGNRTASAHRSPAMFIDCARLSECGQGPLNSGAIRGIACRSPCAAGSLRIIPLWSRDGRACWRCSETA